MNEVIGREVGGIDNQKIIKRKNRIYVYIYICSKYSYNLNNFQSYLSINHPL